MACLSRVLAGALVCMLGAAALAADGPPVAPVHPVTNTYCGHDFVDPYQWMEDGKNPEFQSWMKGQDDYTREVLARLPGREALRQRLTSLSNAGTVVYQVGRAGSAYFYLKQAPADDSAKLFVRAGIKGPERLLVDPNKLGTAGTHYSLDWFVPSPDGRRVAYGVSPGGSEDSTLGVIDARSGIALSEHITRARFGVTSWSPDGTSFFYSRLAVPAPGAAPGDKYKKSMLLHHVVGQHADGDGDRPTLGFGLTPAMPVAEDEETALVATTGSRWAVAIVRKFVKNEVSLYTAPLASLGRAGVPWRKVADESDEITDFSVHADTIYLLSHAGASNFKVESTSLGAPDVGHARLVVPAGIAVLKGLGGASDALYVQTLDGGLGTVLKVPYDGGDVTPVPLPYAGAIAEFSVDARHAGMLVKMTSWTQPQLWYAYDPAPGRTQDTGLRQRSPVDYGAITSVEVKAPSADGTLVPLSIVYRRDLKMDGSHPTILEGYGSYGITLDPGFNPALLAWLERGGVYAVAHVRGGGENGEDWHVAGQKLNKQNTIADFIGCAQYLVDKQYTSPAKLAAQGGSAGGITMGGAITQRPDLFAAVLDDVGMSDALRVELSPNGPPNIPEFGSVTTEDGFKGLLAMSGYHHVTDGKPYPAVLLTTGIHDPRVESWQMAKMTARLQAATSSGKPILLRVDYDAGHGIGSTKSQGIAETADQWSFLLWQFGDPDFQPAAAK